MAMQIHSKEDHLNPFPPLIPALKAKDAELYEKLKYLHPSAFWVEWKKVHPEDFPHGGASRVDSSSIVPKA